MMFPQKKGARRRTPASGEEDLGASARGRRELPLRLVIERPEIILHRMRNNCCNASPPVLFFPRRQLRRTGRADPGTSIHTEK